MAEAVDRRRIDDIDAMFQRPADGEIDSASSVPPTSTRQWPNADRDGRYLDGRSWNFGELL